MFNYFLLKLFSLIITCSRVVYAYEILIYRKLTHVIEGLQYQFNVIVQEQEEENRRLREEIALLQANLDDHLLNCNGGQADPLPKESSNVLSVSRFVDTVFKFQMPKLKSSYN